MKLEAGKSYYRRDGGVESIVRVEHKMAFNAFGKWWHDDGMYQRKVENPIDLISEVPSADQAFSETAEAGLSVVRESETPFQILQNGQGRFRSAVEDILETRSREVVRACRQAIKDKVKLEKQLAEVVAQRDEWADENDKMHTLSNNIADLIVIVTDERDQYAEQLSTAMQWVYSCPIENENRKAMIERFEALELTPSANHE